MTRALFVGGCPASYHRLEPAEPPVRSALEALGVTVDVSGIYHPDGDERYLGGYSMLANPFLEEYDLIVLFTTGTERFGANVADLIAWTEKGGALVGIHCATDTFADDPAYVSLFGGKFRTHPAQLDITLEVTDSAHPITEGVGTFTVRDELYLFTDYDPARVHLLAQTHSYDDNGPVPLCWTREQGDGRVFYLSLGHNPTTMEDASWQKLFKNGVEWALKRC